MSYHWENIIWQSKNGLWNRGFYARISNESSPLTWEDSEEGYDSEWDDEFDYNRFDYVSLGYGSEEQAARWEPTGNPGSYTTMQYRGNSKHCNALDQLAFFHNNPEALKKHKHKEHLRKNREHFKKLHAEWTPEVIAKGVAGYQCFRVGVKRDERPYEYLGATSTAIGAFTQDGDWLEIEGQRIYNSKTGKFHARIRSFEKEVRSSYGGYRRW